LLKQSLSIGSKSKNNIFSVNLGSLNFDGYRSHSKHTNFNSQIKWISAFTPKISNQMIVNAFYNPTSQDPGGLLLEEVASNPRQGRSQSILFNAGENMWQYKLSNLINIKTSNLSELFISFFTQKRDFQNRLPFRNDGAVAFVRNIYGAQTGFKKRKLFMVDDLLQVGIETDYQKDERNRFVNLNGENGALTLDQDEIFRSLGTYLSYSANFKKWDLLLSGRYENIQITLRDQFLSNGDQSGDKSYVPFTGSMRLGYNFTNQWSVNASLISGFETPTLTEIINNPEGFGFANIDPAYTQGWELMTQFKASNHSIKLTGYQYQSSNELVPYQVAGQIGRVFFRNGGKSDRIGLEGEIHSQFTSWFSSILSGSINQFNLSADLTSSAKVLAGIPENNLRAAIILSPTKVTNIMVDFIGNGSIYADQNNTIKIAPQRGLNFHADYIFTTKHFSITPTFGGRYMLSEFNYNNILINAAANRYYEPLSRMSWYFKMAMSFKR
jgi:iron complex outermembrane receptor protein